MTDRNTDRLVVVTGAGGFIGGHLTGELRRLGYQRVRAVDLKPIDEWYQSFPDVDSRQLDLRDGRPATKRRPARTRSTTSPATWAAWASSRRTRPSACSRCSSTRTCWRPRGTTDVDRYFYSSSACVYAADKQTRPDVAPLKEEDAYPAMPEDGYGWEKLFSERMCRHFREDFGLETRVARYHNVYGPHGTYEGGREKAPAAICRKIIAAQMAGDTEIEVWGDGEQSRSFMYIDDCLHGTRALMASDVIDPINIGSDELVTINQLVDIVEEIAGQRFKRRYNLDAPKGVRGRCSDNTLITQKLGWAPSVRLRDGLEKTYRWIHDQMAAPVGRRRAYA